MQDSPLNHALSPALRELEDALRALSPAPRSPDACLAFFQMGRASMRRRERLWRWGASACAAAMTLAFALPALRTHAAPNLAPSPAPVLARDDSHPELFRLVSRSRALGSGLDAVDVLAPLANTDPRRGRTASELIESGRVGASPPPVSGLLRLLSGVLP